MAYSLRTKLEEQLICPICMEQFKDPKVLPCLHSYCHHCIVDILKDKSNITCPMCRATLEVVNPPDISFLPSNFLVTNLLATMLTGEPAHEEEAVERNGFCEQCDTGSLAENRCPVCEVSLCRVCAESHLVSETTNSHRLLSINESKAEGMKMGGKEYFGCSKHSNGRIDHFCMSCNEAICRLCADETHVDHNCSAIEDIALEEKDEMRNILERVKNRKDELSERLSNVLKNEESLMMKKESVIPEIINYFEELSRIVEKRKNELVNEVTYLTNARLKELTGPREHLELILASCTRSTECAENAFATEDDTRILSQKKNVLGCLNSLNEAAEQKCPIIDDAVEFVCEHSLQETNQRFVESYRILGDLACPLKTTASFKGSKSSIQLRKECVVTVFCRDKQGREMKRGGQSVTPIFTGVNVADVSVHDNHDGSYDTKFVAKKCGTLTFQTLINGHIAPNCTLSANIHWVMREDIGVGGTVTDGGLTLSADSVLGSWCYKIGDCAIDAGSHKWKVKVRYLGNRSRLSFKKEIEVGVVDSDGDLTPGAVKSGLTKKWVSRCSAEVIVTLRLDMSQNVLTVQSTGGTDEMNTFVSPSQCTFHIKANRVSPFLALRGKQLSLSVIHI